MGGPILDSVKDRVAEPFSRARNAPGERVARRLPEGRFLSWGRGEAVGAVNAGIAVILEDTLGIPFGATVDIVDVDPQEDGDVYTVNVNAPSKNIARARAFIDSSTGFTSYLVDEYEIEEAEVLNKRFIRDTHQIKVRISR